MQNCQIRVWDITCRTCNYQQCRNSVLFRKYENIDHWSTDSKLKGTFYHRSHISTKVEFSVSSTRWRISFVENNYYIHGNKPIHIRLWKLRNIKCLLFLISNYDLLTFKNVVPQIKNEFWPYIFEHCKFHHIHSPFTIILLVKGFFF